MKKLFLAGLISLFFLTGCGKTEMVVCKSNEKSFDVEINSVLNIELKGDKLSKMDMKIDAILPESYLSQKQVFIDSLKKQYENFDEKYGIQPNIIETDAGAQIKFEMTDEQAKNFYGDDINTETSKSEIIEELEKQGFTCE